MGESIESIEGDREWGDKGELEYRRQRGERGEGMGRQRGMGGEMALQGKCHASSVVGGYIY
ncbi:unnamed protein product [Prunus armeniaca]|uniref:Uncharacterized protein n=1 Tax=Prunus armeniaca TaxID=36596 RepID=A0A6J5XE26_PRUAR|nr:unnamed protein product [Prunus armeniaca]